MLKRSPSSKYVSLAATAGVILVVFIIFTTISTWRSETLNHGERIKYFSINNSYIKGEEVTYDDLKIHEMYSKDAPKDAIKASDLVKNKNMFANIDITKNSILQKDMLVNSIDSTLDEDSRIIFIPTSDIITSELAQYADIIATMPDGFGSDVIAYDVQIMFDATPVPQKQDITTESNNTGYFVKVTVDEASDISTALSTGELHFALKKSIDP